MSGNWEHERELREVGDEDMDSHWALRAYRS